VIEHYGKDRTFSVPILTLCALCGRLGSREQAWSEIPQLPFELAALPHQVFQWLRLPVVSYAIPALIAIGLARHENSPRHGRFLRGLREAVKPAVLSKLHRMQPPTGGFLEATPLTGFVVMSLASSGLKEHPVTKAGAEFLRRTQREDGSWPIDVDLNTWLTSLSVQALTGLPAEESTLSEDQKREIVKWLLAQQHCTEHPFTHAQPGGWAWTNLAGGVPDGDDTAGVLLSLHQLGARSGNALEAAVQGVKWLLDLQNRDGGVPTFCRGWLNLPFDESCPDITAHALAAWSVWRPLLTRSVSTRAVRASRKALNYLLKTQNPDGTWRPLWFGSQSTEDHSNPLYGTARVLMGLQRLCPELRRTSAESVYRAQRWLLKCQNVDGGWGASPGASATIEETALALDALSHDDIGAPESLYRGLAWLLAATENGTAFKPSPIGLYFSKLWYSERLYPIVFTCSAIRSAAQRLGLSEVADSNPAQDAAS
jgi:squalene-hopene/tetraprenyl-beta-curcumene cyclase